MGIAKAFIDQRELTKRVVNFIADKKIESKSGQFFPKYSPHNNELLWEVSRSNKDDVHDAVTVARASQSSWGMLPAIQRGAILFRACALMESERDQIAAIVALETGKSPKDALAETEAAIALGRFYAGEGQRLYGKTTTSAVPHRTVMTLRQPCGVAALIVAANTPIANVAWKSFPALICGNSVILKAAEDTPMTAFIFADILSRAGIPAGVFNVIQGLGNEAGAPLVTEAKIDVISFTGSTAVGQWIGEQAGRRLIKTSLELGGKNPFIVCDDANLDHAVHWVLLSAFSNAGQRCAAASRILIFENVYADFVKKLVTATLQLRIGNTDNDQLGPVINQRALERMLTAITTAQHHGAKILCGGERASQPELSNGFYMMPTLIEESNPDSLISTQELFGPIALLFKVKDFEDALQLANRSSYGLTAAIHTHNFHRAMQFVQAIQSGVATVNGGTFGSEPHMPFGGVKHSGNGSREPGTEALDIYTELKDIYLNVMPHCI